MPENKDDLQSLIERHEEMEIKLKERREELPCEGSLEDRFPPDYIRLHHQSVKLNQEIIGLLKKSGKIRPMDFTLNQKMFACKTAFLKLKLTTLLKLNSDELATGKYILVRVMEDWYRRSVVSRFTVIEDHRGHVFRFALYNYLFDESIYPGDVIVIKEPYLSLDDEIPTISCNCPTDIVVVRPSHPLYPKIKRIKWQNDVYVNDFLASLSIDTQANVSSISFHWIKKGNELYEGGKIILSREAYKIGIKLSSNSDPEAKTMRLNLLVVHNRLRYYEWVVENGKKFLEEFPNVQKAYLHLGKAYYMLRDFVNAREMFLKLCKKNNCHKNDTGELMRTVTVKRLKEKKGIYNFDNFDKLSEDDPFKKIDCADFCALVEIKEVAGKGRGLVLTEDVRAGDLLVVSKALAVVLNHGEYQGVPIAAEKEPNWNLIKTSIVVQLARLVMKNPKTFGTHVYKLDAGIGNRKTPQLFCDPKLENEPISDIDLLRNIVETNVFCVSETTQNGDEEFKVCGLFLLPSYINHSCIPNVCQKMYNDVMVLTASKDMKKGTELTRNYFRPGLSFEEKEEFFEKHGFTCQCAKCEKRY